jgi:hypothetical protein
MKKKNKNEERFFFVIFIIFILVIILLLIFKKSRSSFLSIFLSDHKFQPKKKVLFKGEEITRSIFEDIFNQKFPKIKPNWLINPETKKTLELDGYNSTIETPLGKGLAFEYNGSQHEHFNPRFHKTYQDFLNQKFRDKIKVQTCRKKGVLLISIPYVLTTREEIERFVKSKVTFIKNKNKSDSSS